MQDNIHNFAGHFNGFAGQCNIVQASEYTKKINQLYYLFPYEEAFV